MSERRSDVGRGAHPGRGAGVDVGDAAEILTAVREVMRESLELDVELTLETELTGALELDSLDLLTLVAELENHFELCLDEDAESNLRTVGDLVRYVAEHKGADA